MGKEQVKKVIQWLYDKGLLQIPSLDIYSLTSKYLKQCGETSSDLSDHQ